MSKKQQTIEESFRWIVHTLENHRDTDQKYKVESRGSLNLYVYKWVPHLSLAYKVYRKKDMIYVTIKTGIQFEDTLTVKMWHWLAADWFKVLIDSEWTNIMPPGIKGGGGGLIRTQVVNCETVEEMHRKCVSV